MARNDLVLLDSLIDKAKLSLGTRSESEYFELFCFDQILKDFDPSYEELEDGWTDGGDDGGIDGFFVVLDDAILSEVPDGPFRRNPILDLFLISAKRTPTFRQAPLNALISSLPELLDLTKSTKGFTYPFASQVVGQRALFRDVYVGLAEKHPRLHVHVIYASRGDSDNVEPNVASRAALLREELLKLFSEADVSVEFYGAKELLELARRQKVYSLRLRFIESNISRESTDYVVLSLLKDYFDFVTDEDGRLRRYLFESNVRDYLGEVAINRDIATTLASREDRKQMDFWWLNNGITLLASAATIAGKELCLENVQIVNGLQTTEVIYRYFTENRDIVDDRAALVKVVITSDDAVRDRIIKATNYQNMVDLASLRATDKIQRDIEHFLGDHGWFYDRQKGLHKNQGRHVEKIVSIAYVGCAMQAIALRNFSSGFRGKTRWLRNDKIYNRVFNEKWDLRIYLVCLELSKAIEKILQKRGWGKAYRYERRAMIFATASVLVSRKLGKAEFNPNELAQLERYVPTDEEVIGIMAELGYGESGGKKRVGSMATKVVQLCSQLSNTTETASIHRA